MRGQVQLSLKNYHKLKKEASGYFEEYKEKIEDLEERNEKLQSAICVVNVGEKQQYYDYSLISGITRPRYGYRDAFFLKNKSQIAEFAEELFKIDDKLEKISELEVRNSELETRIENFQESKIGKLLNFFGIKI